MKKISVAVVCLLLAPLLARAQERQVYQIVAAESSFWVYVPKAGLLSALAHNHQIGVKSFSGRVSLPEGGAGGGALELEIEAKSLTVLDKNVSEEERGKIRDALHNEVLESAKHPKIVFKSVSVTNLKQTSENDYSFTLNGDLTLHGVTRSIAVPTAVTVTPQQLRATGKYILRQTDFGIEPYSAAGGTIKVKNEIVVNFIIIARAG
jgi:polyisoprenoid-binding protein YceI